MKNKPSTFNRSGAKWLPGAMALAATTAESQAASVQITLNSNYLALVGGNLLNPDLTGDSVSDVAFNTSRNATTYGGLAYNRIRVGLQSNMTVALAMFRSGLMGSRTSTQVINRYFRAGAAMVYGGIGNGVASGASVQDSVYLNRITFSDSRINSGGLTEAWLEVRAFNTSEDEHTIALTRLIFDDASTTRPVFGSIPGVQTEWSAVPEPSSFALLSLGAAGLLARRRRQAA